MANFNINKVILGGRLTGDPEIRQTANGIPVLSFSIAVNRRFASRTTDDAGQQTQSQQADFINCVAWRQTAEFIARYFRRGSSICITGSIQTRSYTDQQNQKRTATEVQVEEAYFVDSKGEGPSAMPAGAQPYGGFQQASYQQAPQYGAGQYGQNQFASAPFPSQDSYSAPSYSAPSDQAGQFEEVASDDDLPF